MTKTDNTEEKKSEELGKHKSSIGPTNKSTGWK